MRLNNSFTEVHAVSVMEGLGLELARMAPMDEVPELVGPQQWKPKAQMFCFAGRFDCSLSVENLCIEQMRVPLTRTKALLVHNWVLMIGSYIIMLLLSAYLLFVVLATQ